MPREYDVVIIGGGAAGENVAGRTAPAGLSTVIIESALVGGECSYWACMPSKALLRPRDVLDAARRVPGAEGAVTGDVDVERTLRTRNAVVSKWDDSSQVKWVASVDADLIRGRARITGVREVAVETETGTQTLTARRAVVVATGSTPFFPPVEGLAQAKPWITRDATSAQAIPESLIVIGAGAAGLEMAQAFQSLGAQVTLLDRNDADDQDRMEPFALAALFESLLEMGVRVITGVNATWVERAGGVVRVRLDNGDEVSAAEVLVATGRQPALSGLGLEAIGLEPDGSMQVNSQMQVEGVQDGWLYAVGDAAGRAMLTHQGKYQARIAGDHITGKKAAAIADNAAVPSVIFTDPQIASVGLTERAASEKGLRVRTVELPWAVAAATLKGKGIKGGAKFIVDEDKKCLVGATFVGPDAGELLHAATIAVIGQVPLEQLWHAVPAFPTMSEIWLRFLEEYGL